jgi:hypothetical protein
MLPTKNPEPDKIIYVTDKKSEALWTIYKTNWKTEAARGSGIWFFTEWKSEADMVIYFTKWRAEADWIVCYTDWKTEAGKK